VRRGRPFDDHQKGLAKWHPALARIYALVLADILTVEDDPALRKGLDCLHGRRVLDYLDDYEPSIGPVEFILDYLEGETPPENPVSRALSRIDIYSGLSSGGGAEDSP
jgi:hypothetical protein